MKLVIVGCNPGDRSARVGHYYAGRGNEFWPLLYESGVLPELLEHRDDKRMIEFGIGLTDLVKRPTRGVEELRREEFAEGRILLSQKLEQYAPQVIAFNGKGTFENFAQRPCKLGLQKGRCTERRYLSCRRPAGRTLPAAAPNFVISASLPSCSRNCRSDAGLQRSSRKPSFSSLKYLSHSSHVPGKAKIFGNILLGTGRFR